MDDQLLDILNKLRVGKFYFPYFEGGKLTKYSYIKERKLYIINLQLKAPLPAFLYISLHNSFQTYLKKHDKDVKVALYIILEEPCFDSKVVKDYIVSYVDNKLPNSNDFSF